MKGNKALMWIVVCGVALRVVLWCCQSLPQGDDGMRYLHESINIVDHGVFSTEVSSAAYPPSAHDMPLWPAIMASVYWITGSPRITQYTAGVINILLVVGSTLLLISMLRSKPYLFTDRQIMVSTAVLLFMPESVIYSLCHMPDQLAVFMIILGLWCLFRASLGWNEIRYMLASSAAFLASIYAKPICIPLSIALLISSVLLMKCLWIKRIGILLLCFVVLGAGLAPWVVRNKLAFGTAGLTTIAGTNLYGDNWGRFVSQMPEDERKIEIAEMQAFAANLGDRNLIECSRLKGEYAKRKILVHLPQYVMFTLKTHFRMYAGTGSIAMLRYLGLERACDALGNLFDSTRCDESSSPMKMQYTILDKSIGLAVQIVTWIVLICGYCLILRGIVCGTFTNNISKLAFVCPILSLVLLAVVIGPVVTTRYRFIMIPFFAILAGYSAVATCKVGECVDN